MVTKLNTKPYLRLMILVISLVILVPLISNQALLASTTKQRIYDFAELLNPEQVRDLEALAEKHSKKRETDFIILTSKDAGGKDIVKYMEDFYDENGLGYDKAYGNTVILTLDMGARDVYVAGFYKGEKFLDNQRSDLVRRKITPDLSDADYHKAFTAFIKTASKYMGYRPGVDPSSPLHNIWMQLIISFIVGSVAIGIMTYKSSGRVTVNEGTYRDPSTSRIIEKRDDYIRTTTTKTKRPSNNSSGGGSSFGGGGGISGGGHSHSGSRGKF